MTIAPSCPVLVVHEDDAYRRALIKALDERNFSVTYTDDSAEAARNLGEKNFIVAIIDAERFVVGMDDTGAALIVLGDAGAELRKLADETLRKPVDAVYVADRARTYCR